MRSPFERGRALHWKRPVDRELLDACAALLVGNHDFTAFTPTETYHVRFERDVIRAEWVEEAGNVLAFWIEADTFMRHMVRTLVGTMLRVRSAGPASPGCSKGGRAARRGTPRRRTGCIWSRCATRGGKRRPAAVRDRSLPPRPLVTLHTSGRGSPRLGRFGHEILPRNGPVAPAGAASVTGV